MNSLRTSSVGRKGKLIALLAGLVLVSSIANLAFGTASSTRSLTAVPYVSKFSGRPVSRVNSSSRSR